MHSKKKKYIYIYILLFLLLFASGVEIKLIKKPLCFIIIDAHGRQFTLFLTSSNSNYQFLRRILNLMGNFSFSFKGRSCVKKICN